MVILLSWLLMQHYSNACLLSLSISLHPFASHVHLNNKEKELRLTKRCRMQRKKAFKIACPECNEVAYTIEPETDIPCPYCGFDFKWKSQGRKVIKEVCLDYEKVAQ
jgi:endogenous inhibitor of DNA gyrase (YacG/DUF329 family)